MDNQISTYQDNSFKPTSSRKYPSVLKIIFIILGLVLIVELVLGLKTLLTPVKIVTKPPVADINNSVSDGVITLSSVSSSYKVGDAVPVMVKVTTGGHLTAGVDLVVRYDSERLTLSPSPFEKGTIYQDYPSVNVEKAGVVRISGLVSTNSPGFNGSGEFGTINFIAKAIGVADISLEFKKELTQDTNILEITTSKDILGSVTGVKINIQ